MLPLRHVFPVAFVTVILITIPLLVAPADAESDQAAIVRTLGPRWQQLSRRAGMIFAGTVVAGPGQSVRTDRGVPSVEISLHVDRAIVGVEPGQVLTIHEWIGALPRYPGMHPGEHFLIFLYPPSHLGLTSPVGGSQGLLRLDSLGTTVIDQSRTAPDSRISHSNSPTAAGDTFSHSIALTQLERAIRAARGE